MRGTQHFANFLYDNGRFRDSAEIIVPAARWAAARSTGYGVEVPMMVAAQGRTSVALGRTPEGLEEIDRAIALASKLESPELDIPLQAFRARALVDLGRLGEARAALDRARAIQAKNPGEPLSHIEFPERRWLVASGRAAEALAAWKATRVAKGMAPSPDANESAGALTESAWLELEAGHDTIAEKLATLALQRIASGGVADFRRDHEARATLVLGKALLRQHRPGDALPVLHRAVAEARAAFDTTLSADLADALETLAQSENEVSPTSGSVAATEAKRLRSTRALSAAKVT